jgi:signal transduction histidine kinase
MLKAINSTIQTVRRISTELRPGMLDDLGIAAAIEWQSEEFEKRTEIECEVSVEPEDLRLNGELSIALFRIFQESLTNIARHSKATHVDISLIHEDGKVELTIRDNGKGIDRNRISDQSSFGLMGIRERAAHFGGTVKIRGLEQMGTVVSVSVPYPSGE